MNRSFTAVSAAVLALGTPLLLGGLTGSVVLAPASDADITQEELEEMTAEISSDLEELRGVEFRAPVRVAVVDPSEFLELSKRRLERDVSESRFAAEEAFAKLLGLIPADMDLRATHLEVLQEHAGGSYDPVTGVLHAMQNLDVGVAKVVLAHELTHALDDQRYGLQRTLDERTGNTDALLAYQAVIEGSGTALMTQWVLQAVQRKQIAWRDLTDAPGLESDALAVSPEYIWKPQICIYMRGAAFLVRSDRVIQGQMHPPDLRDLQRAFTDPPLSSEQILHPEKYWDEERYDPPRELQFQVEIPEGWYVESRDTLGELGLALFTTPVEQRSGLDLSNPVAPIQVDFTNAAARGWGGDRFLVLRRAGARVLLLVTRWDSADDADEFLAAAEILRPRIEQTNVQICLETQGLDATRCVSGCRMNSGTFSDEVVIVSWVGVDNRELEALLEGIDWKELGVVAASEEY